MLIKEEVKINNNSDVLKYNGKTYELIDATNLDSCNDCVFDINYKCKRYNYVTEIFPDLSCRSNGLIFKEIQELGIKKKLIL